MKKPDSKRRRYTMGQMTQCLIIALCFTTTTSIISAHASDGSASTMPSEMRELMRSLEGKKMDLALAGLPLQMRTAYAVGGIDGCETVISVSNFAKDRMEVEVEFFTGFNFFQRGIARLVLASGETGELATVQPVSPFVVNAVRDSNVAFEGYANIHAKSSDIGAHAHMVCMRQESRSFQDINIFRVKNNRPFQEGD